MSTKRRESAKGRKAEDGTVLCSCGCGQVPKPPRRSWFSDACVEAWKIRNDPGHVRRLLEKRDKGVCAVCGCDSNAEYRKWLEARKVAERFIWWLDRSTLSPVEWINGEWLYLPRVPESREDREADAKRRKELYRKWMPPGDWTSGRNSGWDADHILEVVNGGGQCGLENYQTLCHPCHKAKTKRLAAELAQRRRKPSPQPELVLA